MSYVLRNKQNIFFSFLACKTLRVIVRLFFSIFSSSTIFWWLMYLLPFIFIYKKGVFLFLNYLMWLLVFSKHSYSLLLMGFIVVFFVFYLIRRIYIWSISLKLILCIYDKWTQSNVKSLQLIDVSNPIWYLERSAWKSSSITSFGLWLIMISIFWMHYTAFIIICRWNKVNCHC